MSRPNAFMPTWPPPRNDLIDDLPEFRQARAMFDTQLASLGVLANQAMAAQSDAEIQSLCLELAAILHNISGTAAYFGQSDFGTFACDLEQPVRTAPTADLLRPLCARILDRMAPSGYN